jgi:hypothetical protein
MPFQKGRAKIGGRKKGSVNKSIFARQQAIAESMQTLGLAPEATRGADWPCASPIWSTRSSRPFSGNR